VTFLRTFHHDDRADHLSGCRDVEVQRLAILGRRYDWCVGERCLEPVKRLLSLSGPGEALVFLQVSVEGVSPFRRAAR
jgi:hypothetical protein